MIVWESDDVLTAPSSALFQRDGVWAVFTVDDGRARIQTVEVGHRSSATVEILRGLEEGAEVIVFPSDELDAGLRVKPRAS